MKHAIFRLLLRFSSTRAGGLLFVFLLSPLDRWLLTKSSGRISIAGLGAPTLLLTTIGRKTGINRATPLLYLKDSATPVILYVIGSSGGQAQPPAWFLNLQHNSNVTVTRDGIAAPYKASTVHGPQQTELWRQFTQFNPGFTQYQNRVKRTIPIIKLTPLDRQP
ncbi:MAG: nitroreductase family deazaflavin-dependent oxidoreductase [Gammaproteobacteria bacterium]|jgi:deazaflavin-dependent oxidoreductase (nitroreductase family)|nr:nitroreductase family deazaflavin-dependent oxidoreductase [Gammaproteobacteria bacterium]